MATDQQSKGTAASSTTGGKTSVNRESGQEAMSMEDRFKALDNLVPYGAQTPFKGSNSRYSRYLTRYTNHELQSKPLEVMADDPASSWIPYVAVMVLGFLLCLLWFILSRITSQGSVMTNPAMFTVGMVIFVFLVVLVVVLALGAGHISYNNLPGSNRMEVLGRSMFKAAITLAVILVVWAAFMTFAA